jgi:hypothetical protein
MNGRKRGLDAANPALNCTLFPRLAAPFLAVPALAAIFALLCLFLLLMRRRPGNLLLRCLGRLRLRLGTRLRTHHRRRFTLLAL